MPSRKRDRFTKFRSQFAQPGYILSTNEAWRLCEPTVPDIAPEGRVLDIETESPKAGAAPRRPCRCRGRAVSRMPGERSIKVQACASRGMAARDAWAACLATEHAIVASSATNVVEWTNIGTSSHRRALPTSPQTSTQPRANPAALGGPLSSATPELASPLWSFLGCKGPCLPQGFPPRQVHRAGRIVSQGERVRDDTAQRNWGRSSFMDPHLIMALIGLVGVPLSHVIVPN